jgi:ribosomal protein S18 acetylase RimI-like enzyme
LGIGKRLIEQAILFGETQKYSTLTLGLSSVNIVAINLFQKYGFKVVKAFEIDRLTGLRVYKMEKILS